MATLQLFGNLPMEIVKNILTYNKNFVIRRGVIITIKPIPKNDKRYDMLRKKPEINPNPYITPNYISQSYVCLPKHDGDMAPHFLIVGKDRKGQFILLRLRGEKLYPGHKPYTYIYHYLK
jgi:hypothetical protein